MKEFGEMEMVARQLHHSLSKEATQHDFGSFTGSLRVSSVPLGALFKGLVPMILLLLQRVIGLVAFVIFPLNQAILVILLILIFNYFISGVPKGQSGVFVAIPPTKLQIRICTLLNQFSKYEPPAWVIDNHWSTMLPLVLFNHSPKQLYRQTFLANDGAKLGLDWYIPESVSGVIVVVPGLNGSSQGGYVVDLMNRMGKLGFAIAVMNGRGAGRSPIEAVEHAFHLGRSSDLLASLEAVEELLRPNPVPIHILGYSAGGIRAMKFASVYGETLKGRVTGIMSFGASVRNTHTLGMRSSTHVYQPVITHAYAVTMLHKLLHGVSDNVEHIESLFTARAFDTFRDFDTRVTSVLHKMTLEEYEKSVFAYHDDSWKNIAVPTLIVNAIDDPVLHIDDAFVPEMATMNSNICQLVTSKGGHIGWPTGFSARDHGYRWMSDVCWAFIQAISD